MLRYVMMVLFLFTFCYAQDTARMDQVVQYYVSNKQFMGSVLVARDKDVLFNKGYGSANLEWNIPNTPATKFRLGSITKQFTAAAILLLEEKGNLKIEDPIKKHMPDAPATWDNITFKHLLTHTSGIPDYFNFPEYPKLEPFPITPLQLVALFRDKPLEFQPGEKMKGSSAGYALLGYLIEKVSGESYQDFIQKNILTPLGMKDSGYDSNTDIIPRRAAGYEYGPNGLVNTKYAHMSLNFSAAALYSTTEDLFRWEKALFGGKLLTAKSLEKMTTPFMNDAALGLVTRLINGRKAFAHGGSTNGFFAYMAYFPEDKLTVVALGNLNGAASGQIVISLASLAYGDKVVLPSERKEITVLPKILEGYVGTYQLGPKYDLMITLENGQLMEQTGYGILPLFGISDVIFFSKVEDDEIEFTKDEKGAVSGLILHQGWRDVKAPRTSDTVLVRKEIVVSPKILTQYVGTYEIRPGFDLMITLERDQLLAQTTAVQQKFPLFAETETKYFTKIINAQIEFLKDEKGAVTHLMLYQGPDDIKAQRK